jgi:hypothetical protein
VHYAFVLLRVVKLKTNFPKIDSSRAPVFQLFIRKKSKSAEVMFLLVRGQFRLRALNLLSHLDEIEKMVIFRKIISKKFTDIL